MQGEGSAEQICQALEHFSRSGWAEAVILARGGGSLEDLWSFNEERVARAIAACSGASHLSGWARDGFHHRGFCSGLPRSDSFSGR